VGEDVVVRHLSESQAVGALRQGRAIEQLLTADSSVVAWLRLSGRSSSVELARHRVQNVGSVDFMDVYEFPPTDIEEEHGEGVVLATFRDASEAFTASVNYGARADRWVNEGMVQDEYADATRP
jgi:hypothetical protein